MGSEHTHVHSYFAEVHADKNSQFFIAPHDVPDTEEIKTIRQKLDASPNDYDILLELASKLNFQLRYRETIVLYSRALAVRPEDFRALYERAARFYKTLQFDKALSDYSRCDELSPGNPEVLYRLGITLYAMKRNSEAAEVLSRCADLYAGNPEMLVASNYWLALAETRAAQGKYLWKSYDFSLVTDHHIGYRDGLKVLCGNVDADETYREWAEHTDALNASIVLYALVVYYRRESDTVRADEVYKKLLAADEYWAGFAYIAAWADTLSHEGD